MAAPGNGCSNISSACPLPMFCASVVVLKGSRQPHARLVPLQVPLDQVVV
jgi:hypothetical protein